MNRDPEQHLTREHLLRMVLRGYASESWYATGGPGFAGRAKLAPKVLVDRGKVAAAAVRAKTLGELVVCVCNSIDVALTDVGRKAGVSDPRMGSICRGEDPTDEECRLLRRALEEEVERVCSKS